MGFITFKHSFNSGDAITILPGIKSVYQQTGKKAIIYQRLDLPADYSHNDNHPIKSADGRMVCMNRAMFDMLKPLIEAQEYIERFEVWNGEKVDFDFDLTRQNSQMPLPGGNIFYWPTLIFPQLVPDFSEKWINTPPDHEERYLWKDYIIVNRTERYRNPYINYSFLKPHEKKIAFVGTGREHDDFCKSFDLNIIKLPARNFLYLAIFIDNCRFFMGNQSLCYHIAEATNTKRILEICTQFPNTFPTSKDGYPFIAQEAVEYFFNKLLIETNA